MIFTIIHPTPPPHKKKKKKKQKKKKKKKKKNLTNSIKKILPSNQHK